MKTYLPDNVDPSAVQANADAQTRKPSRLLHFVQSRWTKWILVLVAIKVCMVIIGVATCSFFNERFAPTGFAWLAPWYRLDVIEFFTVTVNGYQPGTPNAHLIVKFPVIPLMIRGMAFLGIYNVFLAGFVMATLASLPIPVLMEKLTGLDYPKDVATRAAWFLLIFPMSFCLHLPLTEGIFMVLVLNAFLAARNKDWSQAAVTAALASATRVNGVLLLPALIIEAIYQYSHERKWCSQWAWLGLAPLGGIIYGGLSYCLFGDVFAYMKYVPEYANQHIAWPWVGVMDLFHSAFTKSPIERTLYFYPECIATVFLAVIAIWTCLKCRPSYSAWTILNLLLFTSTTFILSLPRYAIAIFPMFFFLAETTKQRILYVTISCALIIFFIYFSILFAAGWWAF